VCVCVCVCVCVRLKIAYSDTDLMYPYVLKWWNEVQKMRDKHSHFILTLYSSLIQTGESHLALTLTLHLSVQLECLL
jgi:hypothetical protein